MYVYMRARSCSSARAYKRVHVYAFKCEYIRSFVRGVGKNVIPSAPSVVPRRLTPLPRNPSRPTHSTAPCALRRARQDHEFVSTKLFESTSRIIEVRVVKRQPLLRRIRPKVNEIEGRVALQCSLPVFV